MKILALDYGTKRIGVATNYASLVEPVEVIANKLTASQPVIALTALDRIASLCQELAVEQVVVGISEQAMAVQSQKFAALVAKQVHLPVHLMDETLSSHEVAERLREAQAKLKTRQGPIDHFAAAIILENWLDLQGS